MGHMLRCLFYLEARFSFTLTAEHVAGVDNGVGSLLYVLFWIFEVW